MKKIDPAYHGSMYTVVFANWRNKIVSFDFVGFTSAVKFARLQKDAVVVTWADGKKREVKYK